MQDAWEVGGNCNFMIAAARLGMRVGSVGHIGPDTYGRYVADVLQVGLGLEFQERMRRWKGSGKGVGVLAGKREVNRCN